MKNMCLVIATIALSACATTKPESEQPPVGLANPASVYCKKLGGSLAIVKEEHGESGYCTLPNGERIEEWALYRRAR